MGIPARYVAEFISTFALIFIGAGAVVADATANLGIVGVALAHGLVLMSMIYATGHISGAHVNPAVTIGMLVTKRINLPDALGYIASQLAGAAVGGMFVRLIFASAANNLGTPGLAAGISVGHGIIIEAVLTFLLVFTIFGTAVDKRAPEGFYGIAIGLVLVFDILVGGSLTGAGMNPARAFGPALAGGFWENHIVYWVGPILGSVIAASTYSVLCLKER